MISDMPARARASHFRLAMAALAITLAMPACKSAERAEPPAAADSDAQLMSRSMDLLYQKADPVGAEATLRQLLQRTPTHYGAQYQLAVALDRGGRPAEARDMWRTVLDNAQSAGDSATMRTARTRLAAPDTASVSAMMTLGLDLLYRQNNPSAAAEQFRSVLRRNATHYGATYQLAAALDKAGNASQARPLWEKVLGMATGYKDEATAATARARLAATR